MRIAYVINSLEGGGAASPVPAIANVFRAQGCEVRIFVLTPRDLLGLPAIEKAGLPVLVRDGGERDHIAALRWLDRQISDWRPDIIWTSLTRATLLGQIVGQMRHIGVVSWQHQAYLKRINKLLLQLRQKRSLLWVADSANVAALTESRLGVEPERIAIWPIFSARADAPQATPWQPGDTLRIGSLGRLHKAKGYDVLIAALARLHADGFTAPTPMEVVIAGQGAERAALQAQAKAAGVSEIAFVGFTQPQSFLASLHLYVQPSRREGLCIAAHEAMQAGLPIIASAVGEMPHTIIDGVTGRSVPPVDPDALAAALADMLRDPDRLATMGQASRQRVLDLFGGEAFARAGTDALNRAKAMLQHQPRKG